MVGGTLHGGGYGGEGGGVVVLSGAGLIRLVSAAVLEAEYPCLLAIFHFPWFFVT
jgi:hypothetical protein